MSKCIPAHVREQQINNLPNITFVRWDGEYRGSRSKAVCRCAVDGFKWSATVNNLLDKGSGCPECAGKSSADKRRISTEVRIEQINNLSGIHFVRWDGEYTNNLSKAVCRCDKDHEWSARLDHLLNSGSGCPECAFKVNADKKRIPADVREQQIHELPGVTFVRWDGEYSGVYSKAIVRCDQGHEWSTNTHNLLNGGRGCPQCAEYGYNPSKPGTLYALRSECGTMVKIGISNDYQQRHTTLKRATPFAWDCTELLHGDGALIAALEKAFHGMTEPVEFVEPFDGYTEWRRWRPEIANWFATWR